MNLYQLLVFVHVAERLDRRVARGARGGPARPNGTGNRVVPRWSRRWSAGGDVLLANDAAALYLMTMKPELTGSIVLVTLVNLLVVAVRVFRGWKVLVPSATR
jgi:hypothetical protein